MDTAHSYSHSFIFIHVWFLSNSHIYAHWMPGTLTLEDEVATMIWIHGCTAGLKTPIQKYKRCLRLCGSSVWSDAKRLPPGFGGPSRGPQGLDFEDIGEMGHSQVSDWICKCFLSHQYSSLFCRLLLLCMKKYNWRQFLFRDINSQIHGHGYGGQIIMEGAEEVNFKHMVICKNEVNLYIYILKFICIYYVWN